MRVNDRILIDLPPDDSTEPIAENVDHFCLVIEPTDMVALQKDLRSQGLEVEEPEAHYAFGAGGMGWQFKLKDPNGHKLELRCYPEGHA